ncbi:MAG: carbamoyltransferase [Desulfomonile tiedjei]|nr:carbamoyltransferase [Desulfomonile tiedjei]
MSVILGINAFHPGASASLVIDGVPVCAIAEERLNRVKYYAKFPVLSIRKCLEIAGITFRDVDYVALGNDPKANLGQKAYFVMRNVQHLPSILSRASKRLQHTDLKNQIVKECGIEPSSVRFKPIHVEHHLAHAASSYFISDWERCAAFTVDGSGDFVTCTLGKCENDSIELLRKVYVPHSLGTFYTMVCEFIGYSKYGDEGKVMALAAFGNDSFKQEFRDILTVTPEGFTLNLKYFMPLGPNQGIRFDETGEAFFSRQYSDRMEKTFGSPRDLATPLAERDMNLAAAMQHRFEQAYFHMLNLLHGLVPDARVAIAGGSALNSVANGKIAQQTPFRETSIQPAAGDEGNSLGAALYVARSILHDGDRYIMKHPYLGPEYSESVVQAALEAHHIPYRRMEQPELLKATARSIADGAIVGWFQGRMEWGPRALGNRSILAHPGLETMKETLNARIKRREWFRPFAPAVLAERQNDLFEESSPSPFMLHVYKIRPEWREKLPAVNHVDNTGRLQTVTRECNALFHNLIRAFDELTGIPVILNTSFNENEPIVCSPEDAIECFLRTRMDALAIGPFFCKKELTAEAPV